MSDPSPHIHYCPSCGAQLTGQVDTCPACGQSLCPACGEQVPADAMRCPACGVTFEAACPQCGATVAADAVSCAQCGAQFEAAVADNVAPALAQAEHLQEAYLLALQQLKRKTPPQEVEAQLVASGVTAQTSQALVETLQATRRPAERTLGRRAMMLGGLWVVGGLAITLLGQSLANERGGSYFILWGAVIIGAVQFLSGLRQFLAGAPASAYADAQPQIDPVMAASGYVWPLPPQNKLVWVGVAAFLGIMALLSVSSAGAPLIDKAATQVNLTAADIGSDFTLVDEAGTEIFADKDVRDASQRTLQGESSLVQSTVLVWKQRVGDSPLAMLTAFDKQFREEPSITAKFESPRPVSVGAQDGALESFQLMAQGRTMQGYLVAFVHNNVMVLVLELGLPGTVSEQQILSHAQLIDQRLK